jgi:hypothetical protein
MKATELKQALRKGLVKFTFKKLDGSIREAFGTRNMNYVPTESHPKGTGVEVDSVVKFYDIDKQAWRSVSVKAEIEIQEVLIPTGIATAADAILQIPVQTVMSNRPVVAATVEQKIDSDIDYSKHGAITEALFRFCEKGVTYTELNMFYLGKSAATYNSKRDRGGSLTKHMISLREPKHRQYSKRTKYITKENGKWYTVNC